MKCNPLFPLLFLFVITSCSSVSKNQEEIQKEIQEEARMVGKNNGAYYTILEFEKGTSALTNQSKNEIKEFVHKASVDRKELSGIKILVWADKDYSILKFKHKEAGNKIIEDRTKSIKNYLNENLKMSAVFSTYNMINTPNALREIIEPTSSYKKVFEKTGSLPTQSGGDLASLIEHKSGKALILMNYE